MEIIVLSSIEIEAMKKEELDTTAVRLSEQLTELISEHKEEVTRHKKEVKVIDEKITNSRSMLRLVNRQLKHITTRSFKEILFEEHGEGIPRDRLEKCYQLAYTEGHSAGEMEVQNYFIDYVELFK